MKLQDNKAIYHELCEMESSIPLFSRSWWLDAVCGPDNWNVVVVEKGGMVRATMPYFVKIKKGFKYLIQPPLTQTLGPWLRPFGSKHSVRLSSEKDYLNQIIDQLPIHDYFFQNWHYSKTNWLPFYWRKFQQTTRYTYILKTLDDEKVLWSGLRENIRTDIRKAEKRYELRIREDVGLDAFYRLNQMTFMRQNMRMPYSYELLKNLDDACSQRKCRKIFIAEDPQGRHHAGVYIVWDENSAYYLMGGSNPELRNSGANSLCMWHAIRYSASVTKAFDFEGSMLEPVERFFRAFGAEQVPYYTIYKIPSRLLRIHDAIFNVIRKI